MAQTKEQKKMDAWIGRSLKKIAQENGGQYTKPCASGILSGYEWTAQYNVMSSPGGEAGPVLSFFVNGKRFSGPTLQDAIKRYESTIAK